MPVLARRILLLSIFPIFLTSCSIIGYAYSQADWVILKELEKYLDLGYTQRTQLRNTIKSSHQQHRQQEVPYYVAYIRYVRNISADGLNKKELDFMEQHFKKHYHKLLTILITAISPSLSILNNTQLVFLNNQLNHFYETKKSSITQTPRSQRKKIKRFKKAYGYWFGQLTHHQKSLIEHKVKALPQIKKLWYEYHTHQQQALISLLQKSPDTNKVRHFLEAWWINGEHKSETFRGMETTRNEMLIDLTIELVNSLNQEQKKHLDKKLNYIANELEGLINDEGRQLTRTYYKSYVQQSEESIQYQ